MTAKHIQVNAATPNLLLMPSMFNDTLRLLLEAHEYFYQHGAEDQEKFTGTLKSIYACEMSRITLRLSCVMAWLMVRKAVLAGKMTDEEALRKYELDSSDVCLFRNEQALGILPSFMSYLLDNSLDMYQRVWRLDGMMRGKASPEAV